MLFLGVKFLINKYGSIPMLLLFLIFQEEKRKKFSLVTANSYVALLN